MSQMRVTRGETPGNRQMNDTRTLGKLSPDKLSTLSPWLPNPNKRLLGAAGPTRLGKG